MPQHYHMEFKPDFCKVVGASFVPLGFAVNTRKKLNVLKHWRVGRDSCCL
jgi:hypothetical protein